MQVSTNSAARWSMSAEQSATRMVSLLLQFVRDEHRLPATDSADTYEVQLAQWMFGAVVANGGCSWDWLEPDTLPAVQLDHGAVHQLKLELPELWLEGPFGVRFAQLMQQAEALKHRGEQRGGCQADAVHRWHTRQVDAAKALMDGDPGHPLGMTQARKALLFTRGLLKGFGAVPPATRATPAQAPLTRQRALQRAGSAAPRRKSRRLTRDDSEELAALQGPAGGCADAVPVPTKCSSTDSAAKDVATGAPHAAAVTTAAAAAASVWAVEGGMEDGGDVSGASVASTLPWMSLDGRSLESGVDSGELKEDTIGLPKKRPKKLLRGGVGRKAFGKNAGSKRTVGCPAPDLNLTSKEPLTSSPLLSQDKFVQSSSLKYVARGIRITSQTPSSKLRLCLILSGNLPCNCRANFGPGWFVPSKNVRIRQKYGRSTDRQKYE